MSSPILADRNSWESALKNIWNQYRTWAITATAYKSSVTRWRSIILAFSILGAVIGTLSQQLNLLTLVHGPQWLPSTLGIISGAALGLAAYFTREALSPDAETKAARARAAAEGFKSEAFLIAAVAPPYNTAITTDELFARTSKVTEAVDNLAHQTITTEQGLEGIPTEPLSAEAYVKARVDDQIDGFYLPRARAYETKLANGKYFMLGLGTIAVLLGLGSAKFPSFAGWIAVIGTLTAAVAARHYAARYQFLIVTYQATAEKLRRLKTEWEVARKTDPVAADQKLIVGCEETISSENTGWMAEFTKKQEGSGGR